MRWWLAAATGTLLLGGVVLVHQTRMATPKKATPRLEDMRTQPSASVPTQVNLLERIATAHSEPAPSTAPSMSREEAERHIVATLETRVREEGVDFQWSRATEARIGEALRSERMAGSSLINVECRRSLCRLDVAHTDGVAQDQFFEVLPLMPPFDTEGFLKRSADSERPQTRVYIARAGRTLPRPTTM